MSHDYFAHKAEEYDQNEQRVANVENIANAILSQIQLDKQMHIMDFGSGTGLLLERTAPYVNKITAVDISKSMNAQLAQKKDNLACELEIRELNLATTALEQKFDGIVSSMTMHHIEDTKAMFAKFYAMLNENGFIAIADLDLEDNTFHKEDTGVYHFGFDRGNLLRIAQEVGFQNASICDASTVHKPQGSYPVFLLTASR